MTKQFTPGSVVRVTLPGEAPRLMGVGQASLRGWLEYAEDINDIAQADVIAGDFHLIRRYLPARLDGKAIVTNTTTRADRADLAARGVRWLCTTTPLLAGRSLGTNALEAAMLAARGPSSRGMERADFESLLQAIDYRPEVLDLSSGASWRPGNSG